jgi:hypothetical protein
MRSQEIDFIDQKVLCVFPGRRANLGQAITQLRLQEDYPVIVLIGGDIDEQQAKETRQAVQTIAKTAEEMGALIVCGGTNMGVMSEIGQIRQKNGYTFPLIGIAPQELVTWPDGPRSTKILWWGVKRWQLEPHYSHFILVPGSQFGDESPWVVDAATVFSKGHKSVTILINGGEVSRKDIDLSLETGRPVIALSRTGRLADELARQPERHQLISVAPANVEHRIVELVHTALSTSEINVSSHPSKGQPHPVVA